MKLPLLPVYVFTAKGLDKLLEAVRQKAIVDESRVSAGIILSHLAGRVCDLEHPQLRGKPKHKKKRQA